MDMRTPGCWTSGLAGRDGSVDFRLWAPHARGVSVLGDFNGWNAERHALQRSAPEGDPDWDGTWQLRVPDVAVGSEYRFVLDTPWGRFERIDPRARAVTNSVGSAVVTDPGRFDWQGVQWRCPPHERLAIYEMHIGSFGARDASKPGTFDDAIARLPHLAALGINAVQLMPVAEFAGDRSWGYNPAHPFAVESAYGGPDGLMRFVREAHRLGLAVILDVVYNHFGPSDLDLWRFDGWGEGDGGGIYFYNDDRAGTPWGDTRPDYGRPEVRQYMVDNALMWLDEYRVDGLRLDMTPYVRSVDGDPARALPDGWLLMQQISQAVRARRPDAILIAEDMHDEPAITAPVEHGGAGFHAQWDAQFVHPVRAAMITPDDANRSARALADALLHRGGEGAFNRIVYSESHDEVANGQARVPHEIAGEDLGHWAAQRRSALAMALVCTAPGIPMLFQGQEFLQGGWFRDDLPLDWHQRQDFRGLVRLVRDLLALRLREDSPCRGLAGHQTSVLQAHEDGRLLAWLRRAEGGPGDDTVVVVNLCNEEKLDWRLGLPAEGRWVVRFNSDARRYGDTGEDRGPAWVQAGGPGQDGQPATASLGLAPYAMLVLSQDRDEGAPAGPSTDAPPAADNLRS